MNFKIGEVEIGLDVPLLVMAGPCVIESKTCCLDIADRLVAIGRRTGVEIIFKASFDKANRSSISSFRGPGLEKGLEILAAVRRQTNLPVMTDVHQPAQAAVAGEVVDCLQVCLQVPAFLCRQTDLLCACARANKPINVKKGQFLSPAEMKNVVEKIRACGNEKIILTERGTFFGYNRLVNDMTAIQTMKKLGCPVVFDILAKAATAAGANGLFVEVHTEPEKAKSDAACVMPIGWLEDLLRVCKEIFEIVRG
ncbi:MAG: 3-deoxy-8-phosphooctulonate synthase [Planctomycetota bacterium]|jgi:2-dehydro-3-deoxyphosphooctonate aldolase (KDO 8-P synthase)